MCLLAAARNVTSLIDGRPALVLAIYSQGERRFHHWTPLYDMSDTAPSLWRGSRDAVAPQGDPGTEFGKSDYYGYYPGWDEQAGSQTYIDDQGSSAFNATERPGLLQSVDHNAQWSEGPGVTASPQPYLAHDTKYQSNDVNSWGNGESYVDQGDFVATGYGDPVTAGRTAGFEGRTQEHESQQHHHHHQQQQYDQQYSLQQTWFNDQMASDYSEATYFSDEQAWDQAYSSAKVVDAREGSGSDGQALQACWGVNPEAGQEQAWVGPYLPEYEYQGATAYTFGDSESSGEDAPEWGAWVGLNGACGYGSLDGSDAGGSEAASNGTGSNTMHGADMGQTWSFNEYGQRISGDWVEYWDESAQAAYFYNSVTGEVHERLRPAFGLNGLSSLGVRLPDSETLVLGLWHMRLIRTPWQKYIFTRVVHSGGRAENARSKSAVVIIQSPR